MCIPGLCYIMLYPACRWGWPPTLGKWYIPIETIWPVACIAPYRQKWGIQCHLQLQGHRERSLLGKTWNAKGGAVELQHIPNALRCFHQIPGAKVRIWEPTGQAHRDLNLGLCDVETTDGGPRKNWHLAIRFVAMSLIGTRSHSTSGKKHEWIVMKSTITRLYQMVSGKISHIISFLAAHAHQLEVLFLGQDWWYISTLLDCILEFYLINH